MKIDTVKNEEYLFEVLLSTIDMTLRVYTHYQHESRKKETAKKVCEAFG